MGDKVTINGEFLKYGGKYLSLMVIRFKFESEGTIYNIQQLSPKLDIQLDGFYYFIIDSCTVGHHFWSSSATFSIGTAYSLKNGKSILLRIFQLLDSTAATCSRISRIALTYVERWKNYMFFVFF